MGGQRIAWIDVAKAIAIVCVIIGHTSGRDTYLWTWAYSFHIPMFFILSGYTIKPIDKVQDVFSRIIKYFKQLVIPALIIEGVRIIEESNGVRSYIDNIYSLMRKLYWASGATDSSGSLEALGGCWFLIALFYGKIFLTLLL